MAIDTRQLKELIIIPVLKELDLYSHSAINLLLGTCATESNMGTYLKQKGNAPALGIYQMEHATFNDIFENYLTYRPMLMAKFKHCVDCSSLSTIVASDMIWNLKLATAMCRIHYLRISSPLPKATDIRGLANYYKKYYNTEKGKGSIGKFIADYEAYVDG